MSDIQQVADAAGTRSVAGRAAILRRFDPLATWLTDLEPAFADRFPFDPSPFRVGESGTGLPGELPGIWPGELAPAG